jgi:hypothetical protein
MGSRLLASRMGATEYASSGGYDEGRRGSETRDPFWIARCSVTKVRQHSLSGRSTWTARSPTASILLLTSWEMIVYGSPQHEEVMSTVLAQLRARLEALLRLPADLALDHVRMLLIMAGQLEQAAHDTLSESPTNRWPGLISALHATTGHAAAAFYAVWTHTNEGGPNIYTRGRRALAEMARSLASIRAVEGTLLTVKVPEGFAFHALYPEQYAAAATCWVTEHAEVRPRRAVVVGIRTIGTTLAAVVTAALAAGDWQVHSLTVRPGGHPFARTVEIPSSAIGCAGWGLVVDEGPGLSGSSMAAVAEALVRAGLQRSHLCFFPSHGGEPGRAASETVRRWWAATPRYVAALQDLRFDGRSLPATLAAAVPDRGGAKEAVVRIENVSGGFWRNMLYSSPAFWPAVCAPFERPKYRCTTAGGQHFLYKFAGLNLAPGGITTMADAAAERMTELAGLGLGPSPLGVVHGFIMYPWLEGTPLTRADADAAILTHIGRYLAQTAGPLLPASGAAARVARLEDMLYWNTREALGQAAADRARLLYETICDTALIGERRAYCDGRQAPHEWLWTSTGQLVRVDNTGHDVDQTMVGQQSIAWDVAGALVEWGLDMSTAKPLLKAFHAAGGEAIAPAEMTFYRLAYAAFRAGQCKLCAQANAADVPECRRLWRAYRWYRSDLARTLKTVEHAC